MSNIEQDRLVALAGAFQAARLVEMLARDGSAPADLMETMLDSLFVQNPESTVDVFGDVSNLSLGFTAMREVFTLNNTPTTTDTLKYIINLNYLAGKLRRTPKMSGYIGKRIGEIERQRNHFSILHTSVVSSIAELYVETISTFNRRIQVNGFAHNLQQPHIAEKIRCLLFAGIRCSMLWYQLGGRKRHLVFNRQRIAEQLKQIEV